MHKGVVVVKNRGHLIPEDYLQLLSSEYKTAVGGAVHCIDEQGKPNLQSNMEAHQANVKDMMGVQEAFKNQTCIFYFGNNPTGYHSDDLQPFTVLEDADKNPILMAFIEGNYTPFVRKESSHSAEFFVLQEWLIPHVSRLYRLVNGDMSKLFDEIEHHDRADIEKLCLDRGTIVLMNVDGGLLTIAKGEEHRPFEWGWSSNHHGYTGKVEQPAVVTKPAFSLGGNKPKPTSGFGAIDAIAKDKPSVIENPKPEEKKEEQKTDTAIPAEPKTTAPPSHLRGGALKKWYRHEAGFVPKEWESRPAVVMKKDKVVLKSMEDLKTVKDTGPSTPVVTSTSVPSVVTPKAEDKKPEPEKKPEELPAEREKQPSYQDGVPIIPPHQKAGITDGWLKRPSVVKALDKSSNEISDPKKIKAVEDKYPSFTESVGLDGLEDTFYVEFTDLVDLAMQYPVAAASLIMQYRGTYMNQLAEMDKATSPGETPIIAAPEEKKVAAGGNRKFFNL